MNFDKVLQAYKDFFPKWAAENQAIINQAYDACDSGHELAAFWHKVKGEVNERNFFLTKGLVCNTVRYMITDKTVLKALDTVLAYGRGTASKEQLEKAYFAVEKIKDEANKAITKTTKKARNTVNATYYAINAVYLSAGYETDSLEDACYNTFLATGHYTGNTISEEQRLNKSLTAQIIKENLLNR